VQHATCSGSSVAFIAIVSWKGWPDTASWNAMSSAV
jgi:hypothetical protein